MSNAKLIHSLVDMIRNVATTARLDFFVIFQDEEVGPAEFSKHTYE